MSQNLRAWLSDIAALVALVVLFSVLALIAGTVQP